MLCPGGGAEFLYQQSPGTRWRIPVITPVFCSMSLVLSTENTLWKQMLQKKGARKKREGKEEGRKETREVIHKIG
jgi:hypothetical protein